MRRIASFVITLGVAAGLAIGCGGDDGVTGTNGGGNGGNGGGVAVTVEVVDNAFVDPNGSRNTNGSVTINEGETIEFNAATAANLHNVQTGEGQDGSAGDGVPQGGSSFNQDVQAGNSITWTPDAAGTWTIFCVYHGQSDGMYGFTVNVQ